MLSLKGVGATVVARLEQIGFSSLSQLADEDAGFVTKQVSQMMGSTCWHNSPQARASIQAIIDLAHGLNDFNSP
ncbi:helix-hairpin-helix domain-containing protein [Ideonella sp. DXS29W]|uniref:Helix-hairpin-helix domain-containing protein n=1 Tax=Ideonella lacteola TaxID=2984193 RepID=A0ABU9BU30_9BURK